MKRRQVFLVSSTLTALLFSGCGIKTAAQINMENDVSALKEKVAVMEKNLDEQLGKGIENAVKSMDTNYKNSIETSLKNQASIASDIETIRIDFRQVKGNVEEVAHKAEKNLTEDKGKLEEYDRKLRELELSVAKINGKLETLENNQKLFTTMFNKKSTEPPVTPPLAVTTTPPPVTAPPVVAAGVTGAVAGTSAPEGTTVLPSATTSTGAAAVTTPVTAPAATTLVAPAVGTTEVDHDIEKAGGDSGKTIEIIAPTEETKSSNVPADVQKEFDVAYEAFKAEKVDDAKNLFVEFIKKFPNTELTDNAQYLIAECHYKKKEFDKAILEYDKMVANYPKSDKVPSALLKEGFSFLQLNYKDEAVIKLKKLVEEYPDTNQAEIARRKLKVLK